MSPPQKKYNQEDSPIDEIVESPTSPLARDNRLRSYDEPPFVTKLKTSFRKLNFAKYCCRKKIIFPLLTLLLFFHSLRVYSQHNYTLGATPWTASPCLMRGDTGRPAPAALGISAREESSSWFSELTGTRDGVCTGFDVSTFDTWTGLVKQSRAGMDWDKMRDQRRRLARRLKNRELLGYLMQRQLRKKIDPIAASSMGGGGELQCNKKVSPFVKAPPVMMAQNERQAQCYSVNGEWGAHVRCPQ